MIHQLQEYHIFNHFPTTRIVSNYYLLCTNVYLYNGKSQNGLWLILKWFNIYIFQNCPPNFIISKTINTYSGENIPRRHLFQIMLFDWNSNIFAHIYYFAMYSMLLVHYLYKRNIFRCVDRKCTTRTFFWLV